MTGEIPMERMTTEEIARLKLRYINRDGSAEVLCSKAWAHIALQEADITALRAEVERLKASEAFLKGQLDSPFMDGYETAKNEYRPRLIEAEAENERLRARYEPDDEPDAKQYKDHLGEQVKELLTENEQLRAALEDITGAGEEAWGPDRPCVKLARAALKEKK